MDQYTDKIQEIASKLIKDGTVDKIFGFSNGTIPMAANPICVTNQQDIEKLTYSCTCSMNLANYLRNEKGKIAVIAKGCDSRNIVTHIVENQIQRDQLHIIGIPCTGMVDKTKIGSLFDDEIISFKESSQSLTVASNLKELTIEKTDVLKDNCSLCTHRNPVIYDELVSDLIEEQRLTNKFPDVDVIEKMPCDEKWQHFQSLTENCIRCYACKNACPLCYCPTCFVDESDPQWVGKGQDKTDIDTFHFLRAFHCAGRCTDCGACVEACPMNINVRDYTRKLIKDSYELFGWEAGLDTEKRPPLDTYSPDDPDDFIK